ncbi:MAG: hypothetical protein M3384_16655 [Acidobacteriota bacterium]|nr:hypothetical protein [Acidobacteriota bacterium]
MPIETLGLMLVTYIAANVATGFFEEPGKELYQKVKGLFTPDEMIKLNLLEQVPDSPKLQGELAAALDTHLKASPDVAAQLEELLKTINQTPANTSTNFNQQQGKTNINIQGNQGSPVNFNQNKQ